jgi:hypothetical protein
MSCVALCDLLWSETVRRSIGTTRDPLAYIHVRLPRSLKRRAEQLATDAGERELSQWLRRLIEREWRALEERRDPASGMIPRAGGSDGRVG